MHYKKICDFSIFLTSIIVFAIWSIVWDLNLTLISNEILQHIVKVAISFIAAYGSFHFIIALLISLMGKIKLIKRMIFGAVYIEGAWIGYYTTNGIDIICYSIIEQDINKIDIVGQAYRCDDMTYFAKWKLNGNVSLNTSSLSYMYDFDMLEHDSQYTGFANFDLLEKGMFKNPKKMVGYYFTMKSKKKTKVTLQKIASSNNKTEYLKNEAYKIYSNEMTLAK